MLRVLLHLCVDLLWLGIYGAYILLCFSLVGLILFHIARGY